MGKIKNCGIGYTLVNGQFGDVITYDKVISVTLPTASWVQKQTVTPTTSISGGTVTVVDETFLSQLSTAAIYVFTYNGTYWTYNSAQVSLDTYGITYTGTAANADTINVAVEDKDEYSQTVVVSGTTTNTKIDLQPSAAVYGQLLEDGTNAIFIVNNSNVLTAYAIGEKPTINLTIQGTMNEVINE